MGDVEVGSLWPVHTAHPASQADAIREACGKGADPGFSTGFSAPHARGELGGRGRWCEVDVRNLWRLQTAHPASQADAIRQDSNARASALEPSFSAPHARGELGGRGRWCEAGANGASCIAGRCLSSRSRTLGQVHWNHVSRRPMLEASLLEEADGARLMQTAYPASQADAWARCWISQAPFGSMVMVCARGPRPTKTYISLAAARARSASVSAVCAAASTRSASVSAA